jgi:hypothetical protein
MTGWRRSRLRPEGKKEVRKADDTQSFRDRILSGSLDDSGNCRNVVLVFGLPEVISGLAT